MTDKVFYVYAHYKKDTDEIFYIGKGKYAPDPKFKRAYTSKGRNEIWRRIVAKHGYDVKIIKQDITEEDAFSLEKKLISDYGRIDNKTGCLCNLTNGGEGWSGYIRTVSIETRMKISQLQKGKKRGAVSDIVKAKISTTMTGVKHSQERIEKTAASNRGKKRTEEHRQKISAANKGKAVSDETRLKLSISLTGKVVSAETRLKLSEINKGKKLSVETIEKMKGRKLTPERKKNLQDAGRLSKIKKVIDDSTGIIYESLVDAAKATGYTSQTLSRYLRGDRKNKTSMRYL